MADQRNAGAGFGPIRAGVAAYARTGLTQSVAKKTQQAERLQQKPTETKKPGGERRKRADLLSHFSFFFFARSLRQERPRRAARTAHGEDEGRPPDGGVGVARRGIVLPGQLPAVFAGRASIH